jgi:hypothetical protein
VLTVKPITIKASLRWIAEHHSHLGAPRGGLLAASVEHDGRRCCVALAEIPKARLMMNGTTAEISRVASDGTTPHAASKSCMALVSALSAVGYRRFVSATLLGEAGTMYRAAGWWPTAIMDGGEWDRARRRRVPALQAGRKIRWEYGPDASPRSDEAEGALKAALGTDLRSRTMQNGPLFDGVTP